MHSARLAIACSLATLIGASPASAQTATQVVRFEVTAVNQIGVAGSPAPMVIKTAEAGNQPGSVTSASSYAITTNETNQKITVSVDENLPAGVTLELSLAPPSGASSAGPVALGTANADVVTGISSVAASALPMTYRLSARTAARVSAATRVVTFTVVSGT